MYATECTIVKTEEGGRKQAAGEYDRVVRI